MNFGLKRLMAAASVVGLGAVVLMTTGFGIPAQPASAQAPAQPQMSEQAFKNIQIMKGIPVDEFMGTMGLFSAALSVCCGDCHIGAGSSNPQWDADPTRKQVARRMVQMVNAINRDNFGGRRIVTCWTCHRGNQTPASTPAIDMIYGEPILYPADVLPTATGENIPTVDQIFGNYIQALGGAQRLAALTSYVAKGTSQTYGDATMNPAEVYAKAANQLATIVHEKDGDLARTFDGRNGWVMMPATVVPLYPLDGSALAGARLDGQLSFPGGIRQSLTNWKVSFPSTVNRHDVNVVQGTGTDGLVATFYFDKQSGLLTRVIRYTTSSMGRIPTQWDYSDYRAVEGVMIPFKVTYSWISGREDYIFSEVLLNVPIEPAKFEKPAQR
jgi:hypothetical protein